MEDALSEVEVFLLYSLGPSYTGSVHIDLSGFVVPELITERNLSQMKFQQRAEVLRHPGSFSLQKVQASLFLIFSARNFVFAQVTDTVPRTYVPVNGKWVGAVSASQVREWEEKERNETAWEKGSRGDRKEKERKGMSREGEGEEKEGG